MQNEPRFTPTEIRQQGPRALAITWGDGRETAYDVRALRLACACAVCVDEWTGAATVLCHVTGPTPILPPLSPSTWNQIAEAALGSTRASGGGSGADSCGGDGPCRPCRPCILCSGAKAFRSGGGCSPLRSGTATT